MPMFAAKLVTVAKMWKEEMSISGWIDELNVACRNSIQAQRKETLDMCDKRYCEGFMESKNKHYIKDT